MAYETEASGTLWTIDKRNDERQEVENLVESLKESVKEDAGEPWLGGYNKGDFDLDEMYIDSYKGTDLEINGEIEGVCLSLQIPIENNEEMQKIAKEINKVVTIDPESSGLYLKPKDFKEIREKSADSQGRINLGKNYAGKDVRVVVLDE